MKWFNNLGIRNKLLIAFTIVALLSGVVGLIGITSIKTVDKDYQELYENAGVALSDLSDVYVYTEKNRSLVRDILLDKSGDRSKYVNAIKENDKIIEESLKKFEKSMLTEVGRNDYKRLKDNMDKYRVVRDRVIDLALAHQHDQAMVMMYGEAVVSGKALMDSLAQMADAKVNYGRQRSDELTALTNRTIGIMIAVIVAAIAIAIGFGMFIALKLSTPLKRVVEETQKLAQGDLNVNLGITTKDEIGLLAQGFERMAESLNEVVTNIHAASDQVSAGSKQVSASSQALSQGSTEQAASIEETTASMEEIAAQTTQNAANANQANELAVTARDNAVEGNQQMAAMLKAMVEINDSSANISKIIKVIDEIAFQTNILALNAAVEAARAGQHGKGFAVVAEEVRNLAARSANAAKETTAMIEGSIKKVDVGTKIANDTAAALNQIVEDVTKVANLVGQIASASNEQATGIAQVNQAISQVSQVVQTNSATAEESAAASEELSGQADLLKDMVSRFKVKRMNLTKYNDYYNANVMRNTEDMAGRKEYSESKAEAAAGKIRIALSDNEFGKY